MECSQVSSNSRIFFQKRRGLSQVIGSLLMLAIVVPIGTVILFNGTSEINAFNNDLSSSVVQTNEGLQEDIVFEHIRFEPTSNQITVSLLNAGSIETRIDSITILKTDTQEVLTKWDAMSSLFTIKDSSDITITDADLSNFVTAPQWDDDYYRDSDYKISVTTVRGNFFDIVARPYNT